MSSFNTRVELHGVRHDSDTYTKLHAQMEARGFSRTISGVTADGRQQIWHMPPAQYSLQAALTTEQVRSRAEAAVAEIGYTVGHNAAVLVTEGTSSWSGLAVAA